MTETISESKVAVSNASSCSPSGEHPTEICQSPNQDDGTALGKLRDLIQTRTRFAAHDIRALSESLVTQALAITVSHTLSAELRTNSITGKTARALPGTSCRNAVEAATHEEAARLSLATTQLNGLLHEAPAKYDVLLDGLILGPETIYYSLHTCSACHGRGNHTCQICNGVGRQQCTSCCGNRTHLCVSCMAGKVMCTSCHGSTNIDASGSEYFTVQTWVGDRYETRTESRWVNRTQRCTTCFNGQLNCPSCSGTGRRQCGVCSGVGDLPCGGCTGKGSLACGGCDGSGSAGTDAWIEIHHLAAAVLIWPALPDPTAFKIEEKSGLDKIAAETRGLTLAGVSGGATEVTATYAGTLDIMHLEVKFNAKEYKVVAFGQSRAWYDLDNIIQDLLSSDLEALRAALAVSDRGLTQPVATALHNVVASEINASLVDDAMSGSPTDELRVILSADYVHHLKETLLSAIQRFYLSARSSTWWPMPLMVGIVAAWLWWQNYLLLSVAAACMAYPASLVHLKSKTKRMLKRCLGDKAKAKQAAAFLTKAGQHRSAHRPHLLVSLLVFGLTIYGAVHANMPALTSAWSRTFAATPSAPLPQAMVLVQNKQFAQARKVLLNLAQHGDPKAYLPLAQVLKVDDQSKPSGALPADRVAAAAWALKAVGAFPKDATALYVAGDLAASAARNANEMSTALPLLERSAAMGNADAMHDLGLIYIMGGNVPANPVSARHWFTAAANAGRAADMYNLGMMDWQGLAARSPNHAQAMRWWRRSAALGDERAQRMIARTHTKHR
jgi:hypothetical protein